MIGLKTMLNEFVAFSQLGELITTRKYNQEILDHGYLPLLDGNTNFEGNDQDISSSAFSA